MSNEELKLAWELVQNTGNNVFLTGKAGTGKTTFLHRLREQTYKRMVVLAPTGIAAINAHGVTLHSFFQLPFGPFVPGMEATGDRKSYKFSERKRRLIRSLDLVVIDEISMVRADLLDSVDAALRRFRDRSKPFGGVQLLMIGDLQQLAPVAKPDEWRLLQPYYDTPYFFSSRALREAGFVTVELKTVYRQSDAHFVDILNKVRTAQADAEVLRELNSHCRPDFDPAPDEGYIRLTTHNSQADQINSRELEALPGKSRVYKAEVWKEFPELAYPNPQELELKVGAQVMFVKNESNGGKRYFNGMLGKVTALATNFVTVLPQGADEPIDVSPEQWENTRYQLNEESKEIEEELLGTYTQLPLKTAWAITVHKSQGLTFERAIIDVQHSFSPGQTYVALSRLKSLEGLVLSAPIPARAIISDAAVLSFTQHIPEQVPSVEAISGMQRDYFASLVAELFTFTEVRYLLAGYVRQIDEWLHRQQPGALAEWKEAQQEFAEKVEKVAATFAGQYYRMIAAAGETYAADPQLQERLQKGADYFGKQLEALQKHFATAPVHSNNKMVEERLTALRTELGEQLRQRLFLLAHVRDHGFGREDYLRQRALISISGDDEKAGGAKSKSGAKTKSGAKKKGGAAAAGGKTYAAAGRSGAAGKSGAAYSRSPFALKSDDERRRADELAREVLAQLAADAAQDAQEEANYYGSFGELPY